MVGLGAWIPCFPQDVIKSKYQSDITIKTVWGCIKDLYAKGGLRIFSRGLGITLLRAMPVNAATFGAFEMTKRMMQNESR